MYTIVILASIICAANAGVLSTGITGYTSYASSPALGAPLLGSVTYNAPEVTVVKQPVTIDQPEVRYHSVPRIVQTEPIVKTTFVDSPPIVKTTVVQPEPIVKTHHVASTVLAAPAPLAYAAAPAPLAYAAPAIAKVHAAPAFAPAPLAAAPAFSYAF